MKVKIPLAALPKSLTKGPRLIQNFLRTAASRNGYSDAKYHKVFFRNDPCVYCQRTRRERKQWTIEHILPIAQGGKTYVQVNGFSFENIVNCCYSCNVNRSNIPLLVWLVLLHKNEGNVVRAVKDYYRNHYKR